VHQLSNGHNAIAPSGIATGKHQPIFHIPSRSLVQSLNNTVKFSSFAKPANL
jgi:hypothetical protein